MSTPLRRFDATEFDGVTDSMQAEFEKNGVLVLDGMISHQQCDALMARMEGMLDVFEEDQRVVFSTTEAHHQQDDYFLDSGDKIRFFFESDAYDASGNVRLGKERAVNKAGHAMHDLDPVFNSFSRQKAFELLAKGLGVAEPLLLQSMYIFKQPHIGGEVICHQDATYLWTTPQSCLGIWVALEDATEENGCLWGIPGAHTVTAPKKRLRRSGGGTREEMLDDTPFEEAKKVSLPAPKGTVICFGGLFPHLSAANTSDKSRHAYTLHVIDGTAHYPADNWLQRPADMPLRGF